MNNLELLLVSKQFAEKLPAIKKKTLLTTARLKQKAPAARTLDLLKTKAPTKATKTSLLYEQRKDLVAEYLRENSVTTFFRIRNFLSLKGGGRPRGKGKVDRGTLTNIVNQMVEEGRAKVVVENQ